MPLVHLSAPAHLPAERVQALADAVHCGLVSTFGIPSSDRFQLINCFIAENMLIDPHFPSVTRTLDASIVEIKFLHGHSPDEKRAFYAHVVAQAKEAGWRSDDIFITLSENHLIDWSPGRGKAFSGHSS